VADEKRPRRPLADPQGEQEHGKDMAVTTPGPNQQHPHGGSGDIQAPPGQGPPQPTVGDPASAGGWTG